MTKSVAEQHWNVDPTTLVHTERIRDASGGNMKVYGKFCGATIFINQIPMKLDFIVADLDIGCDLLLGQPLLKHYKAQINTGLPRVHVVEEHALVFAKRYCENVATDIGVGGRDACSQCGQFNRRSRTFYSLSGIVPLISDLPVASPNASHAPLEPAWFLHEWGVGVHQWEFVMSHGRVYRTIPPHQHLVL
jgi:hypothetical protein